MPAPREQDGSSAAWASGIAPATLFLLLFGLYAATAPRRIAFEDDGSFVMAAVFLGIPHPPGYPLWVPLAHLFTWLPVGSMAFRVHLSSAFFAAAACALLWGVLRRLGAAPLPAWLAALALGVSPVLWSQAIIAEVYTLNLLLFLGVLALLLRYVEAPRRGLLGWAGFVYGLGLSNHWPLLVLATPGLALLLWPVRRRLLRDAALLPPALAAGLLPYLWLFLRSHAEPPMSFYGPLRDLGDVLYYLSRRGYTQSHWAWGDGPAMLGFLFRESVVQFTALGFLLALAGGVRLWRRRPNVGLALGVVFAGAGFPLLGLAVAPLQGFEDQYLDRLQLRVYPVLSYAVLAVALAFGLEAFTEWAERLWGGWTRRWAAMPGLLLVGAIFFQGAARNQRRAYRVADDYARTVLESLEPGAVLFTRTDADTLPIGYLHFVEGVRPDLTLYNSSGLVFGNRLYQARTPQAIKEEILENFLEKHRGPVYFTEEAPARHAHQDFGFYVKLVPGAAAGRRMRRVEPALLALAQRMNDRQQVRDPWSIDVGNTILAKYAGLLAGAAADAPDPRYAAALEAMSGQFHGLLGRLLVEAPDADPAELLARAEAAEALIDATVDNRSRALLLSLQGRALRRLGRTREAEQRFEASLALDPDARNPAAMALLRMHARAGDREAYQRARDRFHPGPARSPELQRLDREMAR